MREEPDFVAIAWPCGPWSLIQNVNQKTSTQREALRQKRLASRKLLHLRGGLHYGSNPEARQCLGKIRWQVWHGRNQPYKTVLEGWRYLWWMPVWAATPSGQPMKKPTRFAGQEEIVKELRQRCKGGHEHHIIGGSVYTTEYGHVSLASWAGGYPIPLCRAIMKGVCSYVRSLAAPDKKQRAAPKMICTLDEDIPEGNFQDGEEAVQEEEERLAEYRKAPMRRKQPRKRGRGAKSSPKGEQWNSLTGSWDTPAETPWSECSRYLVQIRMLCGTLAGGCATCAQVGSRRSTLWLQHQQQDRTGLTDMSMWTWNSSSIHAWAS